MEEEITRVQPTEMPTVETGRGSVEPGTILGNYRLVRLIGSGMLSEVYQAQNLVANKPCAVKVFRQEVPLGPVAFGRYVHEVDRLSRIEPPNVAAVYGSGSIDGRSYTVMEHVAGTDLRAIIREKAPLSRRTILPVMRGLCMALAQVHAFGLAHGHLHGGQVMVQWSGHAVQIKLLDFGTHHLVPHFKDAPAGWQWTPEHAICVSPEQAKLQPGDTRSDIYALAVLLYEMATGRVPFLGDSFASTLEQHISEQPVPPRQVSGVSAELEETILRGLEKDPRKRLPSVEALLAALDPMAVTGQHGRMGKPTTTGSYRALTASESTDAIPVAVPAQTAEEAPPPPLPLEPISVPRSRRWLFIVLGAVVLACGLAITLMIVGGGGSGDADDAGDADADDKPGVDRPRRPLRKKRTAPARKRKATARPARPAAARPASPPPSREPEPAPPDPAREPSKEGLNRARRAAPLGQLRRAEGFGSLSVVTGSVQAHVFVNGKFHGRGRRVNLPRLAAGLYRVHVVVNGKKSPHKDVELAPGQRRQVSF
jgi:serine/threonine protein kinase